MPSSASNHASRAGRSPHGERGLKLRDDVDTCTGVGGRSPHGERGLKCGMKRTGAHAVIVALLMESVD